MKDTVTSNAPLAATKFAEKAQEQIIISRKDLNKALFMGRHYEVGGRDSTFVSDTVDVTITAPRPLLHRPRNQMPAQHLVRCTLRDEKSGKDIELDFVQRGMTDLVFKKGSVVNEKGQAESIKSASQLAGVLGDIYKAVRGSVEPKWAADLVMYREARETAGQRLDTGLLPRFEQSRAGKDAVILFVEPKAEQTQIKAGCKKACAGCRRAGLTF